MTLPRWRQRELDKLRKEASTPDPTAGMCRWCDPRARKPSLKAAGKGVSPNMCLQHVKRRARHGHPLKPSYSGPNLRPLETLSRRWLKASPSAAPIDHALAKARRIILEGKDHGQVLPTKQRSRAEGIYGRLYAKYCGDRHEGMRTRWPARRTLDALALEVVAIVLSVELAQALDPAPASDPHFADVQVGKVIFRRAGGWSRRIENEDHILELNRYAQNSGQALGYIGNELREAIEPLWQRHGSELEKAARALNLPPIENWTMVRPAPAKKSQRGGKRARKQRAPNPLLRPHDRRRPLARSHS